MRKLLLLAAAPMLLACTGPGGEPMTPTAFLNETTGTTLEARCAGYRQALGDKGEGSLSILMAGVNVVCPPVEGS